MDVGMSWGGSEESTQVRNVGTYLGTHVIKKRKGKGKAARQSVRPLGSRMIRLHLPVISCFFLSFFLNPRRQLSAPGGFGCVVGGGGEAVRNMVCMYCVSTSFYTRACPRLFEASHSFLGPGGKEDKRLDKRQTSHHNKNKQN